MKKIQLTENELKRMIINVMEQMNAPSNEGEPNYSLQEYEQIFNGHIDTILGSIDDLLDLYEVLSQDTSLDPQTKENLMTKYGEFLRSFGVDDIDDDTDGDITT
jgi:hypothetical protein